MRLIFADLLHVPEVQVDGIGDGIPLLFYW
jgi:hypothetical protein